MCVWVHACGVKHARSVLHQLQMALEEKCGYQEETWSLVWVQLPTLLHYSLNGGMSVLWDRTRSRQSIKPSVPINQPIHQSISRLSSINSSLQNLFLTHLWKLHCESCCHFHFHFCVLQLWIRVLLIRIKQLPHEDAKTPHVRRS